MNVPVYFDPKVIDAGPLPVRAQGETPAHYQERYVDWQTKWVWWIGTASS